MNKDQLKIVTDAAFSELLNKKYSSEELIERMNQLQEENGEELNEKQFSMFLFYENLEFTKDYINSVLEKLFCIK